MSDERRKLLLPGVIAWTVVGAAIAIGATSCGDDEHLSRCQVDRGVDAGPMFDPSTCDVTVADPELCPPGCFGLG